MCDTTDSRLSPVGEVDNEIVVNCTIAICARDIVQNELNNFLKVTMALLLDGIQRDHVAQNTRFAVGNSDFHTIRVDLILGNRRGVAIDKSVGAK